MAFIQHVIDILNANKAQISIVLGVLWSIAKAVSNQKAGPVVSAIQAGVDSVAKVVELLGSLLQMISAFLSDLIKSDGIAANK